jgi:murein DD-endopeptidase MepM/ murein hydrolase activator NlpD
VNKNRFTEFFKGKGYYVLLFVGVLAIAAVAIVGSQLASKEKTEDQNYVNLNDTEDNIAANDEDTELAENNPVSEGFVNNGGTSSDETVTNENADQPVVGGKDQVEYEGYGDDAAASGTTAETTDQTEQADATEKSDDSAQAEEETASSVETTGNSVEADTNAILDSLSFKADDGLSWPVQGDVIMNYSMDHTIYFATLMQYKVNPAIMIGAEPGAEVKAATDGMVTSIDANNEETGYTMTMAIGDGYSLVYGQLNPESVNLEVGDTVGEGDVIGAVAEPTKYYSVEGCNLYFQVMENDETVNPMLYLR